MKLKKILLGLAYMSVMASCADLDYHEYTVYDLSLIHIQMCIIDRSIGYRKSGSDSQLSYSRNSNGEGNSRDWYMDCLLYTSIGILLSLEEKQKQNVQAGLECDCDSYNLIQEFYNKRALYCCSTATTFHRHFSRKGGSRNIKL